MILDDIVARKKERLAELKKRSVQKELEQSVVAAPKTRDFFAALKYGEKPAVIAEIKKASPSAGQIRPGLVVNKVAASYEKAGAAAISVITEEDFFQGRLEYLEEARGAVSLPILCKDFIIDPIQVLTARAAGADGLLLIAAILQQNTLKELLAMASQLDMACLVEVHDEEELSRVLETEARLIGINNRDLRTFQVSLGTTLRLRPRIPSNLLVVSESGIQTRSDLQSLAAAGVDAVLVGTSLMRAEDPGQKLRELLGRSF
ncbi:MAG: indole-3-glycerol phosphate synthase TrpC [Deltaproteobacteria bacterium]|nr:MAG: indole-3-glycerol phosphate synthase TrpC [Deltaproteobacteria bacterium]